MSVSYYYTTDVRLATQTWLKPTNAEGEVLPENYRFVARKVRPESAYSGVAIIVRQEMEASEMDNKSTSEFVAAAVNTTNLKKPVTTGCLYKPTRSTVRNCAEQWLTFTPKLGTTYDIGRKTLMLQSLSEPEFYGD